MSKTVENSNLLRKAMQFNGIFSAISALLCLLFARGIAVFIGLESSASADVRIQGLGLLIFAAFLFATSFGLTEKRRNLLLAAGAIAILLDLLWVVGSINILISNLSPLSTPGKWLVAVVAVFVLDFAIFQLIGFKRMVK